MLRDDRLDLLSHEERIKLLESEGAFKWGKDQEQWLETFGQLQIVSKHLAKISRFMKILSIASILYVVISLLNFLIHL